MDNDHCGLPAEELAPLAVEFLEVPNELVQTALDFELTEGTVVADTSGHLGLSDIYVLAPFLCGIANHAD